MYTRYVLGFVFNSTRDKVILIKKNRPAWQKGLYNGIGGKVELPETCLQAIVREFEEETGYKIANWNYLLCLDAIKTRNNYSVYVYHTIDDEAFNQVKSITDEEVYILDLSNWDYLRKNSVSNLPWLLDLILDQDISKMSITVEYKDHQ